MERSSDDPASLALANGIKSEIAALSEGTRNMQQSISMLQVADGSMGEINNMIRRMSSLAAQSASLTYNDVDRRNINQEFQQLKLEIDRIANSTTYNGVVLLKEPNLFLIQTGPTETSNDISRVTIDDMRASGPKLSIGTTSINSYGCSGSPASISKMLFASSSVSAIASVRFRVVWRWPSTPRLA